MTIDDFSNLDIIGETIERLIDRIARKNTALLAIEEAARGLAELTPHANETALLIARIAKEAREG